MKAVIIQSNYIPWKGYFDLIGNADVCVFLDDVQFTKNDWRNRNQIIGPDGHPHWLSIPVGSSLSRKVSEVRLPASGWQLKHLKTFEQSYRNTPNFRTAMSFFEDHLFLGHTNLSVLNQDFITSFTGRFISPETEFMRDIDLRLANSGQDKSARLIAILKAVGASTYLSGPKARSYLDLSLFHSSGIGVQFADYTNYPGYLQNGREFRDNVSILDLLAWQGPETKNFMKGRTLFKWT